MWWSFVINVIMGVIMLITMLYCIGPLDDVLASDSPYLNLFANTGSTGAAIFLVIVLFILIYAGNITALATTSREVWAFSRDHGLPFSRWISRVSPIPICEMIPNSKQMNERWHVPFNSVYITSILTVVLSCVNFGSTLAFNVIVSLSLLGLLSTYMISIGCVLLKRLRGEPLPPARWTLGRFGIPINAFAFAYCAFVIVFSCFPTELPVDYSSANWAPMVWAAVLVLSGVYYVVWGRKHYTPPVMFVEGRKAAGVGLQGTEW